jgi:kynurenine formamidase
MKRGCVLAGSLLLYAMGCGRSNEPDPFASGCWIDLTHAFDAETVYWPTSETFRLDVLSHGVTDKGYFYAANRFQAAEHGGTHIDAPIHFFRGRWTVEEIPIERLIGPAAVIDVSEGARANRDYCVSVDDIRNWETAHGELPEGAIVFFYTGFGRHWPDRARYMGTDARGAEAVADLHFPGLHPDAARWLLSKRAIRAVGLDTPSIDYGPSTLFESHQVLFEKNVPAFENVANLDLLPATGAQILALPMKIRGGTGAPLRIVAWLPNEGNK